MKHKFLVATADTSLSAQVGEMLGRLGYRDVLVAANAPAALDALHETSDVGCIIVTTALGGVEAGYLDGFRLVEAIRKHADWAGIPIFGVIAGSPPDSAEAFRANVALFSTLGASDILYKPIRQDVLWGKIIQRVIRDRGAQTS